MGLHLPLLGLFLLGVETGIIETEGENPMPEYNYDSDVDIDANALDVEIATHANTWAKWAKLKRRAAAKVRDREEDLKTVRSDLTLRAHTRPSRCFKPGAVKEGKSPTGAQVEAYYRKHPKFIKAKKRLHKAMELLSLFEEACTAIDKKGYMLRELVKLAHQDYFATPSIPRDLFKELEKRLERRADDITVSDKKKRKRKRSK